MKFVIPIIFNLLLVLQPENAVYSYDVQMCQCQALDWCVQEKQSDLKLCLQQCSETSGLVSCFSTFQDAFVASTKETDSCLTSANVSNGCSEEKTNDTNFDDSSNQGGSFHDETMHGDTSMFLVYPQDQNKSSLLECISLCIMNLTGGQMGFGSSGSQESSESDEYPDFDDIEDNGDKDYPDFDNVESDDSDGEGWEDAIGDWMDETGDDSLGGNWNKRELPKKWKKKGKRVHSEQSDDMVHNDHDSDTYSQGDSWRPVNPLYELCSHQLQCKLEIGEQQISNLDMKDCHLKNTVANIKAMLGFCLCLSEHGVYCHV